MSAGRSLRVLVVRGDGVGDTVLTAPMLAALRERAGAVEIGVVGSAAAAGVLECIPGVTRVWTIDSASATLARRVALARSLSIERFDVAICVSEKWWPHVWARASRAAVRIGLDPGGVQPMKSATLPAYLTHRVAMPADPRAASRHEVERYLSLLQPLGLDTTPPPLSLTLPGAAADAAVRLVREAFAPPVTPVAVQLSHKWSTEGWPATTAADVCARLLQAHSGIGLVVLAGAQEARLAPDVMSHLRRADAHRVLDTGITRFIEWASLINACRALVTMDTAAVHVAAALGIPVVDVFQDHRFEHFATRWAPWNIPARTIRRPAIAAATGEAQRRSVESIFYDSVASALRDLL